VCVCLYSCLSYPACKSHRFCAILYCHLWPFWLYHIFSHYLINGTIFGKEIINHKMFVLLFSTTFVSNISHSKRNSATYCHECKYVFMYCTRYFCQTLMVLEFSRNIFKTFSNIKLIKIRPVEAEYLHADRQTTDRHVTGNSRFSQFSEPA
jgi:hypothetical protein